MLVVLVDPRGMVESLRLHQTSGYAELDQAAIDAVANWRFMPGLQNGKTVAEEIMVPIRFAIKSAQTHGLN